MVEREVGVEDFMHNSLSYVAWEQMDGPLHWVSVTEGRSDTTMQKGTGNIFPQWER